MQALRAGLKRTETKKNKGKEGKRNQNNVPSDARPILNFRDPNPESSVSNASYWKQDSLQNEPLTPLVNNNFQSQQDMNDRGILPLKEDLLGDSSSAYHKDDWFSYTQHDENMPPTNVKSLFKATKISKWNQFSPTNQPLLVESPGNRSTKILADRLKPSPENSLNWHSIEHEESTKYFEGGSMDNPIRIMSPRGTSKSNAQLNNNRRRYEERSIRNENSTNTIVQKSKDSVRPTSEAFNPFENSLDAIELRRQNCENEFQQFYEFESIRSKQVQQQDETKRDTFQSDNKFQRIESLTFQQSDHDDSHLSSGNSRTRSHFDNDSFLNVKDSSRHDVAPDSKTERSIKPEYPFRDDFGSDASSEWFEGDSTSFQAIECYKNGDNSTPEYLPITSVKKKSFVPNTREYRDARDYIDSSAVDSPERCEQENVIDSGEIECRKEQIAVKESSTSGMNDEQYSDGQESVIDGGEIECRKEQTTEKESSTSEMNEEQYSDKNDAHDIGEGSPKVSDVGISEVNPINVDEIHGFQHKSMDITGRIVTPTVASEPVEKNGNENGLRLVVLLSAFSGTLKQRTKQERSIAILKARNITNIEEVDGSSQCNKDRRDSLFERSGQKGKYPQFFLQNERGIVVHLGDFEWLEYMNDVGAISNETIYGNSNRASIAIKEQGLAKMNGSNSDSTVATDQITEDSALTTCSSVEPLSARSDHKQKMGMRSKVDSVGLLMDSNVETDGTQECLSRSSNPTMKSEISTSSMILEIISNSKAKSNNLRVDNTGSPSNLGPNSDENEIERKALSIDAPLHRETQIDAVDKAEPQRIDGDEEQQSHVEGTRERRYRRWRKSIDGCKLVSANERETPIGASIEELEMINSFLTILRPDFDGSPSEEELEEYYYRSWEAGLTVEFTNRMLNQSMGIRPRGIETETDFANKPHVPSVQTSETDLTTEPPTTYFESYTGYDDREFTRKTPKEQTKMDCLVDSAANLVGGGMVETIRSAISGDGDSRREWRSAANLIDNTTTKLHSSLGHGSSSGQKENGWPSGMVETIRSVISGEGDSNSPRRGGDGENQHGWHPGGMVETIRSALSGDSSDSNRGWRPVHNNNNAVKTNDRNQQPWTHGAGSTDNKTGWHPSDVIETIKLSLSGETNETLKDR